MRQRRDEGRRMGYISPFDKSHVLASACRFSDQLTRLVLLVSRWRRAKLFLQPDSNAEPTSEPNCSECLNELDEVEVVEIALKIP